MQLSIVIPEYNYNCTSLVQSLIPLCKDTLGIGNYEIIVVDDGSEEDIRNTLRIINQWDGCKLIEKSGNTGRANTRNTGIQNAIGEYVLFMDCDAEIASTNYLNNYLNTQELGIDVICGGLRTSLVYLHDDNHLRYRYETFASTRQKKGIPQKTPYESFSTFNVYIKKEVFQKVSFNEQISRYGYEDVLFGIDLKKNNISIQHIYNPLTHTGIDDNDSFLKKTEQSLANLVKFRTLFEGETSLLKSVKLLEKYHMIPLMRLWHFLFQHIERKILLGKYPFLNIFKLYKIGYFLKLSEKTN